LKVHIHHFSKIKGHIEKSQNSRNQCLSYYFCLEGSGSVYLTNGSGSGRPKNIGILRGSRSAPLVPVHRLNGQSSLSASPGISVILTTRTFADPIRIREAQKHMDPTRIRIRHTGVCTQAERAVVSVIKKSQNSRNQCFSYYFCLMIEGSGSGSLTNGSGSATIGVSVHRLNGQSSPSAPPRRRERTSSSKRATSPPKATSNGLPPTPKVHMGACFSKVNAAPGILIAGSCLIRDLCDCRSTKRLCLPYVYISTKLSFLELRNFSFANSAIIRSI
jgi:hypothetical protein